MAEDWIKKIEKLFDVIGVMVEQKVQLAIFMLRGSIEHWWNLKKGAMIPSVIWEVFLEAFNAEYFPNFLRQRKETEFVELHQMKLSVVEYAETYINLGRFALEVIMNELNKVRHLRKD